MMRELFGYCAKRDFGLTFTSAPVYSASLHLAVTNIRISNTNAVIKPQLSKRNIHCTARNRTFVSDYDYDQDCGYDHDHGYDYDYDHDCDYDYDVSSLGDKNLSPSSCCPLSRPQRHHSCPKSLTYFSAYQSSVLVPLSATPKDDSIPPQHQRCRRQNKLVPTRCFCSAARTRSGECCRAFPCLFPLWNMCG